MKQKRQFPSASPYTDARGKRRWRYRKNGKAFELGTVYGSDEFVRRYEAAVQGAKVKGMIGADRALFGTVNDICARFYQTATFLNLSDSTKRQYRRIVEAFRQEHGSKHVAGITAHNVKNLIAKKIETPTAANTFRKRLSQLLDLATELGWIAANPVKQTKSIAVEGGGFHAWTEVEIARFFAVHRPGTMAHRAVTLMLYTGAARVDAVKLGRFSLKQTDAGSRLEYRRQKTRKTNGQLVSIPLHPDLAEVIAACPEDGGTFLQTAYGKKRDAAGLGNAMRDWCNEAGLPVCSSHGLRKACARRLAEAGATAPQIAAVTGHKTLSEVQRYIDSANRELMADDAFGKLMARPNGEQTVVNLPNLFANKSDNALKNKE